MRVLILGAGGMLGHKLTQLLSLLHEVTGTVRASVASYERFEIMDPRRLVGGVEVSDFDKLLGVISEVNPEFIINCVGIIKQLEVESDPLECLSINTLFPHKLGNLCRASGIRLIHISTDGVFSGQKGAYKESDVSDAEDFYGRSKYLGEVSGENCLTVRTSIIGRELQSSSGLVEWFLRSGNARIQGYKKVIYTGLTTIELARVIQSIIETCPQLTGIYHVSSEPISKYDLLCLLRDSFSIDVEIAPVDEPEIDRSLDSTLFRREMNYCPPSWPEMIEVMAKFSKKECRNGNPFVPRM